MFRFLPFCVEQNIATKKIVKTKQYWCRKNPFKILNFKKNVFSRVSNCFSFKSFFLEIAKTKIDSI